MLDATNKNWLKSQSKLAKIVLIIVIIVHLFITILEMPPYWFKIYGLEVYLRGFVDQFLKTLSFALLASLIIAFIPYFIFRKIAKRYKNYLDYVSIILLIISAIILYFSVKNLNAIIITGDRPSPINNCSVSMIGGKGERIYLSYGTIYVWKDDPEKKYHIVQMSTHFSPEVFQRIKCYKTEEEAIADGYKIYSDIEITNKDCMGIDLYLEEAKIKVNGNEKALSILKDNCRWLLDSKIDDFSGDQKDEIAMVTGGAGCGSCHGNILYIIKDDRVIFQKEAEDIEIQPAKDLPGFTIKYPNRKDNEPLCCPSEGIVEFYKTNDIGEVNESFNKVWEIVEPY